MPTEAELRAILRSDLVYFAVGVLILTVAVLTLAQSIAQRFRSRLLLLFGVVGLIYGSRLLLQLQVVQFTLGFSRYTIVQVWAALQYLIPVGGVYLWSWFVSPRSRPWVYVMVGVLTLFAAFGIPHDLITHHPWSFPNVNSVLVLTGSVLTAALMVLDIRQGYIKLDTPLRVAGIGFIVFQLGVFYDNLTQLRVVPAIWTEPFAFTAFLISMAFAIQYRIRADQGRLVALRSEMEQARRIQMSILPPGPPESAFYQVAANYSPMVSVAGDLYDFLVLPDDRLGLFIADVSGHGLAAALVASMLKTALNIHARTVDSPAELLANLNTVFCGQSHGKFVTAAFAVLDAHAQTLTYSAAGHPPVLLWSATTTDVRELEQNGLPLGIMPMAEYSDVVVPFSRGDRLALYTDGIVESENHAEEEFGRTRLSEILKQGSNDPNRLLSDAMRSVQQWHGNDREQSDDLTLVIAQYNAAISGAEHA